MTGPAKGSALTPDQSRMKRDGIESGALAKSEECFALPGRTFGKLSVAIHLALFFSFPDGSTVAADTFG